MAEDLKDRIGKARSLALKFFDASKDEQNGWKYTTTHNVADYPAATLYGTWAALLALTLLRETCTWSSVQRSWALEKLLRHRRPDRSFLGLGLEAQRQSKSTEYLVLHCTNYSTGAALELDSCFDFETPYLHRFLDGDALAKWLDARSFSRPWEEGNNIVNVAAYLALCYEHGMSNASSRLAQLLEWHRKYQNPKTGGFDYSVHPSSKQRLEAIAGAVHNFHLHLYLNEPFGCEEMIASLLPKYLVLGRLTACLSIDLVELAIRVLPFSQQPQQLVWALLTHAEALLRSQRGDGGWLEGETDSSTTRAAGFRDTHPSSCSYATWFRLCSLGMIAIVLLGDSPQAWKFRRTLGMGYAPLIWPELPHDVAIEPMPLAKRLNSTLSAIPNKARTTLVRVGSRFL